MVSQLLCDRQSLSKRRVSPIDQQHQVVAAFGNHADNIVIRKLRMKDLHTETIGQDNRIDRNRIQPVLSPNVVRSLFDFLSAHAGNFSFGRGGDEYSLCELAAGKLAPRQKRPRSDQIIGTTCGEGEWGAWYPRMAVALRDRKREGPSAHRIGRRPCYPRPSACGRMTASGSWMRPRCLSGMRQCTVTRSSV